MLVGVVNAPTRYSPVRNPNNALARRNLVISRMRAAGAISRKMCDSLSALPISLNYKPITHNSGEATYFHATDVGTPLDSIGRYLAKAETAVLESNHDPVLLRTSQRQESLKKRISGPRGHLSNDQAAELVRSFATPRLKRLMLAHLSEECNAAHLAESTMREALASAGLGHVDLSIIQ